MADQSRRKDGRREQGPHSRFPFQNAMPLPLPPGAADRNVKQGDGHFTVPTNVKMVEDKLRALRQYRRACGLCDNCAEKWSRDHKCAATIKLHAMQEVSELFSLSEDTTDTNDAEVPEEQLNLAISQEAVSSSGGPRTMQFAGSIQGIPILVLVDSSSTSSFLSQKIADQLDNLCLHPANHKVQIANGGIMRCSAVATDCDWSMASQSFSHSFKILQLQSYDLIIGIDWLEQFSPMKVDWTQIPMGTSTVVLHGCPDCQMTELVFQVLLVEATEPQAADQPSFPTDIQSILDQYPTVCQPPTKLPPVRPYDHSIPLVQGARPVNIRPYWYPLALKDEIETQVSQMLQQGLIQPSTSSFSSPVLLVKKKDGSWRFCYLNDLIVKGTFPIPVFDQLMDELSGAKWFSILDLFAGYHQVRSRKVKSTRQLSQHTLATLSSK